MGWGPGEVMGSLAEIVRSLIEIATLTVMFFFIFRVLRGTRGLFMLGTAAALLVGLSALARSFELPVLQWIMKYLVEMLPMFVIVVFQAEIRRLLTMVQIGNRRSALKGRRSDESDHELVRLLLGPVSRMSSSHTGALIAIEQVVGLEAWSVSGAPIQAPLLDNQLLECIFFEGTPLHDGGVIIRRRSILAAGCTFPLAERDDGNVSLGMRHKAALGLSEQCDALVVVVSEETGRISVAYDGALMRMENLEEFRRTLNARLLPLDRSRTLHPLEGLERTGRRLGEWCWTRMRRFRVWVSRGHRGTKEAQP